MQEHPSPELVAKNREVQRLLGRCLLRIQHLERLLKAVVVANEHYGTGADSAELSRQRAAQVAKLGMGDLVDLILAQVIHVKTGDVGPDGQEIERPARKAGGLVQTKAAALSKRREKAKAVAHANGRTWFWSTATMSAHPDEADAISKRLTALVRLRNRVVHHFSDEHQIRDEPGCDAALQFLRDTEASLLEHFQHMSAWALELDGAIKQMAQALSRPEVLDKLLGPGAGSDGAEGEPVGL